jgi:stress response protein YsnF
VTLHEERPVVAKETVAVERVGLEKDAVTDSERVNAEVRKEQVDVENDVDRRSGLTDRDRDLTDRDVTDRDRRDRI